MSSHSAHFSGIFKCEVFLFVLRKNLEIPVSVFSFWEFHTQFEVFEFGNRAFGLYFCLLKKDS